MATQSFLEIETKFAVGNDVELPDLVAVDGIGSLAFKEHQELSAIYYDTQDLRLTHSKVTLRRRTGGNDSGWHIKMPAGMGRKEIRAELGPDDGTQPQVPQELLDHVRSIVRDLPLHPIAQVDNQRTEITYADKSGTPVVELCDDHVTATSFLPTGTQRTWREWEAELTGEIAGSEQGNVLLALVSNTLLAAGAQASESPSKLASALGESIHSAALPPFLQESAVKPGTPAAAVVEALRANRDKMVAFDPKVRADEWDSVHQMRVATRELRSHLETFHGVVEGPEIATIESELKALAQVLGQARDAEVVEERWKRLLEAEDSGALDDTSRAHLTRDMGREYKRAHRRVIAALNSSRYLTLLDLLDELLLNPPVVQPATTPVPAEDTAAVTSHDPEDLEAQAKRERKAAKKASKAALKEMDSVMARHLVEAYEKLVHRHKKAVKNWSDNTLSLHEREDYFHDMRKAAKKLRYAAEAAGSATHLDTKALYKACKQMQEVLGDFQDSVTSRDKLLKLAAGARRRGEDTFGYGILYQRERAIGLEALEDYKASFKAIKAAFKPLRAKI